MKFFHAYENLFRWCRARDFAGSDPFDGLNSRFFQAAPIAHNALTRLAVLQIIKRAPVNLRSVLRVPAGTNAKGIALFALAEISRFRATRNEEHAENIRYLLARLDALTIHNPQSTAQNGTSFGYNFDWQSRSFFAPGGTPTIVPTAFAARAYLEAFREFNDEKYLQTARRIGNFIVADLNRSAETADEICFSYTPLDRSLIFNASLLAGETLANVAAIDNNAEWLDLAEKSARFVLRRQDARGAWTYGTKLRHKWVDNFHTAFILSSLWRMKPLLPNLANEIETAVTSGYEYWVNNCFLADGTPKYYDNRVYPVDIHSAAAAIITLCDLANSKPDAAALAEKVAAWTVSNMSGADGFFYYQKHRFYTVKTPFMRWGQAWTAFALARLLELKTFQ